MAGKPMAGRWSPQYVSCLGCFFFSFFFGLQCGLGGKKTQRKKKIKGAQIIQFEI